MVCIFTGLWCYIVKHKDNQHQDGSTCNTTYVGIKMRAILYRQNNDIFMELCGKSCLDDTSRNKINEKNVTGNDPNVLANIVTQEISHL